MVAVRRFYFKAYDYGTYDMGYLERLLIRVFAIESTITIKLITRFAIGVLLLQD